MCLRAHVDKSCPFKSEARLGCWDLMVVELRDGGSALPGAKPQLPSLKMGTVIIVLATSQGYCEG